MTNKSLLGAALLLCLLVNSIAPVCGAKDLEKSSTWRALLSVRRKSRKNRETDKEVLPAVIPPDKPGDNVTEREDKPNLAQILDEALKQEFKHEEESKASTGEKFNETAEAHEGTQETVIIISQKKSSGNHTEDGAGAGDSSSSAADDDADSHESHGLPDLSVEADVDRIIDSHDNEYVLSKRNEEGSMGLTLDPQLIKDLTVLICVSAAAGVLMESLGQPTINGYFIAGSLIGPGGAAWIQEIVQVQSLAQVGVQLLLFTLGLEFDLGKLRAVRDVALLGGLLEVVASAGLGGVAAKVIGVAAAQGAFVGAVLAMSSTSIVIKCLQEARVAHHTHAQITIGTLILQDCCVGLLFAFMPVLSAASNSEGVQLSTIVSVATRVLSTLGVTAMATAFAAYALLPRAVRTLHRYSPESFLLSVLGFCLMFAMATTRLGVSAELGAFLAGVALATTDQHEAVLHATEPLAGFFLALFVASTGLTISPSFLMEHLPVLAAGVMVVITAKSLLIAGVVAAFGYPADTALAVGINLAQVGEFGFVLLSLANQSGLVGTQVYYLLMGICALSLLLTPFLLQVSIRVVPRVKAAGSNPDLELSSQVKRHLSSPAARPDTAEEDPPQAGQTGQLPHRRGHHAPSPDNSTDGASV